MGQSDEALDFKNRVAINLINRVITALETPGDLTSEDISSLIGDLNWFAEDFRNKDK